MTFAVFKRAFKSTLLLLALSYHNQSFAQTVTFNFTGAQQSWVVPPCVTSINVTMAGADGGGTSGGNGATITGTIAVTPGQTLYIYVGGSGACPGSGWNGGGNGQNANNTANRSCGGGGATDIRIGGTGLANRVMVAAGGGGMGGGTQDAVGGAGGCATGTDGTSPFGWGGGGASQSAGGSAGPPWITSGNSGTAGILGQGGNGATDPCYNNSPGGGGGGGYYGGGGGGSDCYDLVPYGGGSGGGGSSLIPSGGGCNAGNNNGAGYVTITYVAGTASAAPTNTGPYCAGQTIQLNAGGTGTSYAWTGPNGFTSTQQNPTLPATTAAGGTYNVTVNNSGCSATGSTTVVVNPSPNVNAGVDQTVCQGTQVTLSGSGATSYSWNNGVSQGVAFSPPLGTTTYTVTGTSAGCSATDQVNVTVNPTPSVNAGVDQTVCQGTQVTLTASGATSYSWNNGVSQSVAFSPPLGTTTYTVTGTYAGCSATDQVNVTVNPTPTVNAGVDQTACQGTQVTLSGSGATSYAWNNGVSQGVAFSPPLGTTTYTVTGTSAGCSATDQVNVTVNAIPNVNGGSDLILCQGAQATLTATGATNYSWNNGVTQGVAFTPPLGTTIYTVTGTSGGCSATDQVSITVDPFPAVNAGPDQTVCEGTSVTLSATGGTSYIWNNGVSQGVPFTPSVGTVTYTVTASNASCTSTDQLIVTVNPIPVVDAGVDQTVCEGASVVLSASGSQNVSWDQGVTQNVPFQPASGSLIYTVTANDLGCTSTDQVTVNVNPVPVVNAGLDAMICEGSSTVLTASGANSYSWSPGSGNTASITVSPVATTTYVVIGTSQGCSATDQVVVTVNANPVINAGPDVSICVGSGTTLTATGGTQYAWAPVAQNTPSINVAPIVTTTYTVVGTDANNCVGTDMVVVTVNAIPTLDAGANQTICEGESVTLSASGQGTLAWQGGVVNGVPFVPNQSNWYYVNTVDGNNCTNADSVLVTLEYATPASFTLSDDLGCVPFPVTFTNTTPGNQIDCQWTMDGITLSGCGQVNYTFTDPGTYSVSLTTTSINGCTSTITVPAAVYAAPIPDAEFSYSPNTITELNTEVAFFNQSQNASTYFWDFGDGFTSSMENPTHTYPMSAGNYTVELMVVSPYGCIDTVSHPIVIHEELLYFVPNTFTPDGDDYNDMFVPIFTSGFDPFDYELLIFNRWGEILFESHNAAVGWDGTYGGELCQSGTYIWRIEFKTSTTDERKLITGHVNLLK